MYNVAISNDIETVLGLTECVYNSIISLKEEGSYENRRPCTCTDYSGTPPYWPLVNIATSFLQPLFCPGEIQYIFL